MRPLGVLFGEVAKILDQKSKESGIRSTADLSSLDLAEYLINKIAILRSSSCAGKPFYLLQRRQSGFKIIAGVIKSPVEQGKPDKNKLIDPGTLMRNLVIF